MEHERKGTDGSQDAAQAAARLAGLTEEARQTLVVQREVIHAALQEIFSLGWEAGYHAADEAWSRHCLAGLGDDPDETVQHMMQRWG